MKDLEKIKKLTMEAWKNLVHTDDEHLEKPILDAYLETMRTFFAEQICRKCKYCIDENVYFTGRRCSCPAVQSFNKKPYCANITYDDLSCPHFEEKK